MVKRHLTKAASPNLYQLTRCKARTICKELHNFNWLRNLRQITNQDQLEELVLLFPILNEFHLTEQPDNIKWKWTAKGCYSVKSAYEIQFKGSFTPSQLKPYGQPILNRNVAFLHGWSCITELQQLITLPRRTGHTNLNAPYVFVSQRLHNTCSPNAIIQRLLGR